MKYLDTNFKVHTRPTVATRKLPGVDPCVARHSRRCRRAGGGHARSLVLDEALWTTHTRAGVWGVMQVRQVSYPPHEPHAAGERERVLLEEPNKRRAPEQSEHARRQECVDLTTSCPSAGTHR